MLNPDDNDGGGMDFFIKHPGRNVDVSHYLRQTTITRRRQEPWINRVWCSNRRLPTKGAAWKP